MRLSRYTNYAVSVLIHLGLRESELVSIAEIARTHDVSHANLMKVVLDLRNAGYVETVRGRRGGVRLAKPAADINVGELLRYTEAGFQLADCEHCLIASACGLRRILAEATATYLAVLDKYTVADLLRDRSALRELFTIPGLAVAKC